MASPRRKRPRVAVASPSQSVEPPAVDILPTVAVEELAWLAGKISFWFSASNLRKDGFLAKQISEPGNDGGWVDVSVLMTFNMLRDADTSNNQILDAALSLPLQLEVDRTGGFDGLGRIRLKGGRAAYEEMVTPENMAEEDERTLYISPLPADMTREGLVAALGTRFGGDVEYVSLPRARGKQTGAGFGFVEFSTENAAKGCSAALADNGIPEFARRFHLARGISRTKWKKMKELNRQRARKDAKQRRMCRDSQSSKEATQPSTTRSRKEELHCSNHIRLTKARTVETSSAEIAPSPIVAFQAGVIVVASGYEKPMSRGALRELFETLGKGEVAYVDYKSSAPDTSVCRYVEPAAASRATKSAVAPLSIRLLAGEEEKLYWDEVERRSRDKRARASTRAKRRC